jgi:hypothetical protein
VNYQVNFRARRPIVLSGGDSYSRFIYTRGMS